MIQLPTSPSVMFIPSFELYGHVLLLFKKNKEAKEMFEESLRQRMGRIQSIVGLARAHATLGNTKKADFFYQYSINQLSEAKQDNQFVKEAKLWLDTEGRIRDNPERLREIWKWPYF